MALRAGDTEEGVLWAEEEKHYQKERLDQV
jgi:hypothetical protein